MPSSIKTHPPFWIPVWLQTPFLCDAEGQPRPRLQLINWIVNWSLILLLVVPIICFSIFSQWPKVDAKYCPKIIQCVDPCIVEADPDIAGIGMRLSAYIQSICNLFIFGLSSNPDRRSSTYSTLVITSFAIVTTIATYIWQGALSLHHAMIATKLLTITLLPMHIMESWRVSSPGLFIAQQVRIVTYFAVEFFLITHMSCLGSDPQCNLCARSSTFGFAGHIATPISRSFNLAVLLLVVFMWFRQHAWVYGPFHLLQSLKTPFSETSHRAWVWYNNEMKRSVTEWRIVALQIARSKNKNVWSLTSLWLWYDDEQTAREGIKDRQWKNSPVSSRQSTWFNRVCGDARLAIRIPRCQRMIIALFIAGVFIADCERTVRMNLTEAGNKWGYGQIFAIVATLPAIAELAKLILRLGRRPNESLKRIYTL